MTSDPLGNSDTWLGAYAFWSRVARGETSLADHPYYRQQARNMLAGLVAMARDAIRQHGG